MEAFVGAAMNALTRRFEYEADKFAIDLQTLLEKRGDVDAKELEDMRDIGDRLGRALTTLHVKNLSTVWVDWLCVICPLHIVQRFTLYHRYSAYHHSHPTLTERLKALDALEASRSKKAL